MKICHISTVHYTYDTRIYFKYIKSSLKKNISIDYITTFKGEKALSDKVNFLYLEDKKGIWGRIKKNIQAYNYARKTKANIIHFHDPELIFICMALKVFHRKKIIYDIHELYHDAIMHKENLNKFLRIFFSTSYRIIEKVFIRFFDLLVLAEDKYSDHYLKYNYILMRNYINSNEIIENIKKYNNINFINFVHLGSITKARGIYEIVDFAKLLRSHLNFKINMIGPFYNSKLESEIKFIIDKNKLNNYFNFHGIVHNENALQMIESSDFGLCFLHPIQNNKNSIVTKFFEYMSKSLPTIATNIPLWNDFFESNKCGLNIDIFNLEDEVEKILLFLKDMDKINMLKKDMVCSVSKFTWDVEFSKILKEYEKNDKK